MIDKTFLTNYFSYTKSNISSFIFIIPLLIIYELIHFYKFFNLNHHIRNSADIILRDAFAYLFNDYFNYYTFLIFIIFIFLFIYNYKDMHLYIIKPKYLYLMYIEGLLYGFLLVYILNDYKSLHHFTDIYHDDIFFLFYMCLGAGIWEEFLFRFLFITASLYLLSYFFKDNIYNMHIAIISSAIIFSLFHYIGYSSENFELYSFTIRFSGGVILGYIYSIRGLGISAMTHFCYDFFLVSFPLI